MTLSMSDIAIQDGEHTPPDYRRGLRPPWKPGESGNPAGKPNGARQRLGEAFLDAMHADFKEYGISAIVRVREDKPNQYLKVIAMILPKELHIKPEMAVDGLSDKLLMDMLTAIQGLLAKGKTIEYQDSTVNTD